MIFNAASNATIGYIFTAALYFVAWLNPQFGTGEKLISWVAFDKLCLMEFLSVHAITLLAGIVLAMQMEGGSKDFTLIFWGLIIIYFILASATYLIHRDHDALIGFYAILVTRGMGMLSWQTLDGDMLRAEILKNFVMFVPMMILIGVISVGSDFFWQKTFIQGRFGLAERIILGRNLLIVVAYYLLWAFVTWKWPLRIANN